MGVKPDRVTMDRVYLFFKRYNRSQNNLLRYSEFQDAISPVDPRLREILRAREVRTSNHGEAFDRHTFDEFLRLLDAMIETEVQMEAIRQSLRERKNFDVGKAFHTMAAA